jgi:hypothetical protein
VPGYSADDRLRNLQAITDSTLGRLDIEDLLVELLDRVRAILDADTAAVLLLDEGGQELVARAARGLEEEVRQGVRIPLGIGFAGTIAARRSPVKLDRVDETTVHNPILWEKGIRKMLGVPLFGEGDVIGVLHVGRLADRSFTSADTELLQIAAERVAGALHARRGAVEAAAAELLERGLMPTRLPVLPDLDFAARYVPAESRGVGGDWYDTFTVPDGRLWVVTGDVAGHGMRAAVVMGRVKSALRAYALAGGSVTDIVEWTNRKVIHFEMGTLVTLVCATAEPPYTQFEVCSAGHPPPVVASPGAEAAFVPVSPSPPLGIEPARGRTSTTVELSDGGVLLLYTDGLVERRDEALSDGLERLRESVFPLHPDLLCQRVMLRMIGHDIPGDDIALLAIRRRAA